MSNVMVILYALSKITMEGPSNQAGAATEARQKSTRACHEWTAIAAFPLAEI
jgi:hypothetical protein